MDNLKWLTMRRLNLTAIFVVSLISAGCINVSLSDSSIPPQNDGRDTSSSGNESDEGWGQTIAEVAGKIFLGTDNGVLFYAFDTVTEPNQPVALTARLRKVKYLREISGVTLEFRLDDKTVGAAITDDEGSVSLRWTPPGVGDYDFAVQISQIPAEMDKQLLETPPVPLLAAVRDRQTPFVVIDLDHTVVDSSFLRVLTGGGKPMADSTTVTSQIARKYTIIYLTHRPDLLTRTSKSWLRKNGYPLGPLLVSRWRQTIGPSGRFKTARIAELKKTFPNIVIGIGDKLSDAQAYVDNGMTAYLIPNYDKEPEDMRDMAQDIRLLRDAGRLNVVSNWRQIAEGIFDDKKYPPRQFADELEKQASALEQQED